jgi:hypothetical protein
MEGNDPQEPQRDPLDADARLLERWPEIACKVRKSLARTVPARDLDDVMQESWCNDVSVIWNSPRPSTSPIDRALPCDVATTREASRSGAARQRARRTSVLNVVGICRFPGEG